MSDEVDLACKTENCKGLTQLTNQPGFFQNKCIEAKELRSKRVSNKQMRIQHRKKFPATTDLLRFVLLITANVHFRLPLSLVHPIKLFPHPKQCTF